MCKRLNGGFFCVFLLVFFNAFTTLSCGKMSSGFDLSSLFLLGSGGGGSNLSAPDNITATDGTYNDRVVLTWDASGGAAHYHVYRSDAVDGAYNQIGGDVFDTNYEDTGATPGTPYFYRVTACADTEESDQSDTVSGKIGTFPDAPENVTATEGDHADRVSITWDAVTGADHYHVYRCGTSTGTYAEISGEISEPTVAYDDGTVVVGTHYFYKVMAVNAVEEESALSLGTEGWAGTSLAKPGNVSADDRADADTINVTWDSVSGATYYRVFRALTPDGDYTQISGDENGTSYADSDTFEDTAYYYKVKAFSATLESGLSDCDQGRCELNALEYLCRFNLEWDGLFRKIADLSNFPPTGMTIPDYPPISGNLGGTSEITVFLTGNIFSTLYANTRFDHQGYNDHGMVLDNISADQDDWELTVVVASTNVSACDGTHEGSVETSGTYIGTIENHLQIDGRIRVPERGGVTSYFTVTYNGSTENIDFVDTRVLRNADEYHLLLSIPHHITTTQGPAAGAITVSWAPVYGADSYEVYRCPTINGSYTLLDEVTGAWASADGTVYSYTDATAGTGNSYYYKIVAVNDSVCNDQNGNQEHDSGETVYSDPSDASIGTGL